MFDSPNHPHPNPLPEGEGTRKTTLPITLLVALTLLVYARAPHLNFVNFDDPGWVTANPAVLHGLCPASIRYAFTTVDMGSYNPLTWLSLELDATLFARHLAPATHVENVLLHAGNTVLVLLILRRLGFSPLPALIAAAVFGVHPLHVESVAWVTERKDVLCALFFLLAVHSHRSGSRWITLWFALSLLAKPMAVTLPAVLLLLDWTLQRRGVWGPLSLREGIRVRVISNEGSVSSALNHPHPDPLPEAEGTGALHPRLLENGVLWLMAIIASIGTLFAQRAGGELADTAAIPLSARMANAVVAYASYLHHFLWPLHLAAFYPYRHWPAATVLASMAVLVALTTVALRGAASLVGWLWFLGMLVPTIGIVQVGAQAMADRYMYLPMIGLLILLAAWMEHRRGLQIAVAACVLAWSGLTVRQIGFWSDTQTLFTHSLALTGPAALPHVQLAQDDVATGRFAAAQAHYQIAATLDPSYYVTEFDWANLLLNVDPAAAARHYARAAALKPGLWKIENNWGLALLKLNAPAQAVPHFQRAILADPTNPAPRQNLEIAHRAGDRL